MESVKPMTPHTQSLNQVSAVIDACSNLVTQFDTHQFGGVLFLCCLVLVFASVVVAILVWPLLVAVSRQNQPDMPCRSTGRAPRISASRRPIQVAK
jgi:hypothetical protein